MKRSLKFLIAVTLLGSVAVLSGCDSTQSASTAKLDQRPTPVRFARVEQASTGLPIRAVGRLEAKEELQLSFKTSGVVENVFVDEGNLVRKGQRLATLCLPEIEAALSSARNNFEKADRDLGRYTRLFADTLITLEQLQNATTAFELAKAGLMVASFNREHAEIFAPADGRILKRLTDDHELIAAGSSAVVMAAFGRGWVVRVALADRDVVRVHGGDSATIEFDALPGQIVNGIVSEIGAAPSSAGGTYEVEIQVTEVPGPVNGLIGKVSIATPLVQAVTLIPVEALVTADGNSGRVFVPSTDGKTAHVKEVTVAYLNGEQIAIKGEFAGLTSVITSGATKLTEGAPISVVQ